MSHRPSSALSFFAPDAAARQAGAVVPVRRLRRLGLAAAAVALSAAAVSAVSGAAPASADPSANTWYRLRMCESSNNYAINTGNDHYGAYQFDLSTWRSVGGHGYPNQASAAEQDARALILYRERGWQPWQCASILGLREDGDARSGRTGDIHVGSGSSGSGSGGSGSSGSGSTGSGSNSHGVPPWPNTQYWSAGDSSATIARWQNQLRSRGSKVNGNGDFGPTMVAVVKQIQRLNGLPATGLLGPVTWRLAWTGTYSLPKHTPAPRTPSPRTPARGTAPAWPGTRYWAAGDHSATIARWQNQLRARGSRVNGNGDFGPTMLAVVRKIQRENGLPATGLLGPVTWKLAWTGRY